MKRSYFEKLEGKLLKEPKEPVDPSYNKSRVKWWIWGIKEGRLFVVGFKDTEELAHEFGYSVCGDTPFEVEPIPTIDIDSAIRTIKGKRLQDTKDLGLSLQRARRRI